MNLTGLSSLTYYAMRTGFLQFITLQFKFETGT